MTKNKLFILAVFLVMGLVVLSGSVLDRLQKSVGAVPNGPIFGPTGTSNGTTTVKSVPTQIFAGGSYNTYARISNPGTNTIACYLETTTAASSSLKTNAGIIIGGTATSSFNGEPSICFGTVAGCVPYLGPINCVTAATTTIGYVKN